MKRRIFAGIVGAVSAVVAVFVIVAVVSAIGGVPVMFEPDKELRGWEGAQDGIIMLVAFGIAKVWFFPAIALTGAALGALAAGPRRRSGC
jgi:hypothetical protein